MRDADAAFAQRVRDAVLGQSLRSHGKDVGDGGLLVGITGRRILKVALEIGGSELGLCRSAHQSPSSLRFARVPWVPLFANPELGTQEYDFKNVGKGRSLLLVFSLLSSSCLSVHRVSGITLSCMISSSEGAGR